MRVAVLGAGAAGLISAYELEQIGHEVVAFERSDRVGGVWVFDEKDTDRLMYASLRTNLPRDLMAFLDYTFDSRGGGEDDWPRFPGHAQVLEYLQRFADDRDLRRVIEFSTEVSAVSLCGERWSVTSERQGEQHTDIFDAIAVCNGHFSLPRFPTIEGMRAFPADQSHSHDYRRPDSFRGKRVAVVGAGSSGFDLAVEIAGVATCVFWCGENFTGPEPFPGPVTNLTIAPMFQSMNPDGRLIFADGASLHVDAVVYCTGYRYDVSFIDSTIVKLADEVPEPLYRHMLAIEHPTLAFIGVPQRIVPFPLFQMQARWFANLLDGRIDLPSTAEMHAWLDLEQQRYRREGRKRHHYRNLAGDEQYAYVDTLARECGASPSPVWFRDVMRETQRLRENFPLDYRERTLTANGPSQITSES